MADHGTSLFSMTIEGLSENLGEGLSWQVVAKRLREHPQVDLVTSSNTTSVRTRTVATCTASSSGPEGPELEQRPQGWYD